MEPYTKRYLAGGAIGLGVGVLAVMFYQQREQRNNGASRTASPELSIAELDEDNPLGFEAAWPQYDFIPQPRRAILR